MPEREQSVYFSPCHAKEFKEKAKLDELLTRWQELTGKEWVGGFLEGGGVLIKPKLSLAGDTPKSRGG
jgi:hypothetical protein